MTPLNKIQKESIIKRLSFISEELEYFDKFKTLTYLDYSKDRDKQRQIERSVEILLNAVIDVAKIVLAGENIKVPLTYREAVQKLAEIGFVKLETASGFERYIELRNILAHEYLDLKWQKIKGFIDDSPVLIKDFVASINNII